MNNSVKHIIKKQTLNVSAPAGESAYSVQEQLGEICRQLLPQVLERVCNAICTEDYWVKLDKIRLDLGTLPATGIETALPEGVTEKLTKTLKTRIGSGGGLTDNINRQKKSPAAPVELLMYFLATGVLPAWIDGRSVTMEQLFDNAIATAPETLYRFLRHTPHQHKVSKRLSGILSYRQLKTLVSGLTKTTVFSKLIDALQNSRHSGTTSEHADPLQIKEALLSHILYFDDVFPPGSITKQGNLNPIIAERIKKGVVFEGNISAYNDPAPPEKIRTKDSMPPALASDIKAHHTQDNADKNRLPDPYSDPQLSEKNHTKDKAQPVSDGRMETRSGSDKKQREISLIGASVQSCTIYNAGLVLLWPGIPSLLESCGLTKAHVFTGEVAMERAVLLLQYAADGRQEVPEYELPLNKILCGLPIDTPVATAFEPTATEKTAVRELLQAVITEWKALKGSSPKALQANFLQREGTLRPADGHWQLDIQRQTADVLLNRLPWGTGVIKLPWMNHILYTTW